MKTRNAIFFFSRCCAPVGVEGRAVACDISGRCTVTSCPLLLVSGHQQSLGQSGSCLGSCRACLRGLEGRARFLLVLGGALVAAIGSSQCPSQNHALCFPSPAWFRQLGTAGCACSSGAHDSRRCSASKREQLLVLSASQLTSACREHGHRERVELPHLLRRSRRHRLQGPAGLVPWAQVGSFPPAVWADFFKSHPNNIRPLLPWVRHELGVLYEEQWWEVAAAEGIIVAHLCLWGLDEEVLVQKLQNCLSQHTRTFVPRLITAAVRLCGWAVRQHLGQQDPRAAGGEDNGPAASPSSTASPGWTPAPHPASSSSAAGPDVEEEASTSEATLRGGPDSRPSAPVPAEQDQPQEEPGEAAAAGPSAQGCSPSAPGRGRDRLPRGPWRPPKRKASGPRDSAQPCKRPPRRRH
ncbi:uncharacterized protein LOC115337456 [Aquila chrysaetos chrysaetos]|uniref:uncharacterized protein LOC115337456 n=1 Tax=Aquila chrysaetos chrysaetos TaxID=223781 RepID=UPI0011769BB8|nr:uncharacterized protein LOC115337456 [Aquila chrysaetos chrysaetos]